MSGPIDNSVRMSGNYAFSTVQGGPMAGQASGTQEQRKMANFIAVGEDGKAVLTSEELHQLAAFDKTDGDDQLTEKDLLAAGIRGDIIPKILDAHEKSPFSPIQIDFARTTLKDVNPLSSGTEKGARVLSKQAPSRRITQGRSAQPLQGVDVRPGLWLGGGPLPKAAVERRARGVDRDPQCDTAGGVPTARGDALSNLRGAITPFVSSILEGHQ